MSRKEFRETCVSRDGGECIVPACNKEVTASAEGPGDAHHIIERKLWEDGGYIPENGASVCNEHHRFAEDNIIPPQAFWRWLELEEIPVPNPSGATIWSLINKSDDVTSINKWGDEFEVPPWREYRENIKYPSTRHLPFSHERDDDDTAHETLNWATNMPLIATVKMDGGNAMLVKDSDNPIRARNGRHADKDHFDMAKQWYWENDLYSKIPEHLQVFGEWLYAKHSIHYGCDCDEKCDDVGPALYDYFQVFGIYDTRYDLWLGWTETLRVADSLGLSTVPAIGTVAHQAYDEIDPVYGPYGLGQYDNTQRLWNDLYELSQDVVNNGHEGIVIRSAYPFHYGQMDERLGKYVRPGHVKDDEGHWSHRETIQNNLYDNL